MRFYYYFVTGPELKSVDNSRERSGDLGQPRLAGQDLHPGPGLHSTSAAQPGPAGRLGSVVDLVIYTSVSRQEAWEIVTETSEENPKF